MGATIRTATVRDADELARLRWEVRIEHGTPATGSFEAFVEGFRAFVSDVLADGSVWRAWVAADGDRLVGCVWLQLIEKVPHPSRRRWERPLAYLTNMYVEPSHRNAGLGQALMDEALGFARQTGVDGVVLWPSERSVPFYERAGFGAGPLFRELSGD